MLIEAAIVFGGSDTRKDKLLALFRDATEIDQRPYNGNQEWQGDKPESDQNQSIQ